jgi:hypothetical protein
MGLSVSSLVSSFTSLLSWSKDKDVRILMLGLDSAGKVSRSRCEFLLGKSVLTNGLLRRTDNNIVQATGKYPSLPCIIYFNGSTSKIGEVVSTIPSEQIITAIILGSAEADQNFFSNWIQCRDGSGMSHCTLNLISLAYNARTLSV